MRKQRLWLTLALLSYLMTSQFIPDLSIFGRATVSAGAAQQFILVIRDSSNRYEENFYDINTQTLHYARLNYDELDLAQTPLWPRLDQYSAILIMTESLARISPIQTGALLEYVENGGGVAMVVPGWNPQLAPLFGFPPDTPAEFVDRYEAESGVHFIADFFPGLKGFVLGQNLIPGHSRLDLPLPVASPVQVIAVTDSGRPLAWINRYGRGRTIFWNTDFLTTRDTRGFVVQSILSVQPVAVLPIANFATFQIDDFPAAVSTQKIEPIKSEYDMTMVDFYHTVWVPDMLELSRRYDMPYTFLIPFNYNPLIEPPFDFKEWEHAKVTIDGQALDYSVFVSHLFAQEHEMGLHGYNHVSLLVAPDYWIPQRDRAAWTAAKTLVDARRLLTTQETVERLSAKEQQPGLTGPEQAEKKRARKMVARAVEKKLNEALALLQAKTDLETLTAKEQQAGLTPKEKSIKTLAAQKIDQAGPQAMAEAQTLTTLPEEEVTAIVLGEAQALVTEAGPEKMAAAAETVAEMEQQAEDNMALAAAAAAKRWDEDDLGPQPVSYVPPNNIFHPAGTRALLRSMPTLKIMAGVYSGQFETGGHRDFGPEPWNEAFFTIPRVTAEYTLSPSSRLSMISMLSTMGVWTHFIHPDDVFHTPGNYPLSSFHRNPNALPWRGDHTGRKDGFYYHLVDWLDFNEEKFPWLRYVYTYESLDILQTHFNNQVTAGLSSEAVQIKADSPSFYFIRVNNGQRVDLNSIHNAQFIDVHHGDGYRLYTLRGLGPEVQMDLLPAEETAPFPSVPVVVTPPPGPVVEENIIDYQSQDAWGMAPIPTTVPTVARPPTATPDFEAIPVPTPTVRNRP